MVPGIPLSSRFRIYKMVVSAVSQGYRELKMRFSDSPHNSETSDMRDVLSWWCRHITRKSTWIFKIWLRFVKYWSSLSREWNLHEYDPVVAKLEQFEVQLSETLPPLPFLKNVPDSRGLVGRSRVVGSTSVLDFIESMWDMRVTYVGILSTISSENGSEKR